LLQTEFAEPGTRKSSGKKDSENSDKKKKGHARSPSTSVTTAPSEISESPTSPIKVPPLNLPTKSEESLDKKSSLVKTSRESSEKKKEKSAPFLTYNSAPHYYG